MKDMKIVKDMKKRMFFMNFMLFMRFMFAWLLGAAGVGRRAHFVPALGNSRGRPSC